jgi:hypothetical protein
MGFIYFIWNRKVDFKSIVNLFLEKEPYFKVRKDESMIIHKFDFEFKKGNILRDYIKIEYMQASDQEDLKYWYEEKYFNKIGIDISKSDLMMVDYYGFKVVDKFLTRLLEALVLENDVSSIYFGEEFMNLIIPVDELLDRYMNSMTFGSWRKEQG